MLYDDLADGAFVHHTTIDTTRKGVAVGVSRKQWNKGRLEYQHRGLNTGGLLTTFEQNVDALSNINETLDLVEAANIQTYGVANFEGLDRERLAAIRENAEPGLENFVDQSMKEYMEAHNV
jgi:hypothetical protein